MSDALRMSRLAYMFEPEPDSDANTMANSIINRVPVLAGVAGTRERRQVAQNFFQLSRELMGNVLAANFASLPERHCRAYHSCDYGAGWATYSGSIRICHEVACGPLS